MVSVRNKGLGMPLSDLQTRNSVSQDVIFSGCKGRLYVEQPAGRVVDPDYACRKRDQRLIMSIALIARGPRSQVNAKSARENGAERTVPRLFSIYKHPGRSTTLPQPIDISALVRRKVARMHIRGSSVYVNIIGRPTCVISLRSGSPYFCRTELNVKR